MSARAKWIVAIVGLLAGNVLAMVILATVASVGHSEVIPDYYNQGVHYDDAIAQGEANRALGWRVDATLTGGELVVVVHDAKGAPIDGAVVRTTGYPRAHAAERIDVALVAGGAGSYRARADHAPGIHDLAITIERGGARYLQHVVVDAR
jgi:nitrogen fixation protein FixH